LKLLLKPKLYPKAHKFISLLGYTFQFVQYLLPARDENGKIIKLFPQKKKRGRKLHQYGKEAFCSFKINAPEIAGVYLWVLDNEIIYVGRTKNLAQRFNNGYGKISASNCYKGGTITNCRLNKALLNLYEQGKIIGLYFYKTRKYKALEKKILQSVHTLLNIKSN